LLSDEEQDGAVNVELLRDIRVAFGDAEVIRSADLVTKLTADPERPWAEWRHGRPLTQKQLGGLLRPFGIVSETVSIPGLNDAKGYRRAHFEEPWAAYCSGQNTLPADFPVSKRRNVGMSMESAQVSDFRSVAEPSGDGSKNGKLSYSHAGFDASTLRKAGNSGQGHSGQEIAPPDADLGIPEGLRRCDHCGQLGTVADPLSPWDWPGRPAGVRLHGRCEAPWMESGK
jgi:hypothetical protein